MSNKILPFPPTELISNVTIIHEKSLTFYKDDDSDYITIVQTKQSMFNLVVLSMVDGKLMKFIKFTELIVFFKLCLNAAREITTSLLQKDLLYRISVDHYDSFIRQNSDLKKVINDMNDFAPHSNHDASNWMIMVKGTETDSLLYSLAKKYYSTSTSYCLPNPVIDDVQPFRYQSIIIKNPSLVQKESNLLILKTKDSREYISLYQLSQILPDCNYQKVINVINQMHTLVHVFDGKPLFDQLKNQIDTKNDIPTLPQSMNLVFYHSLVCHLLLEWSFVVQQFPSTSTSTNVPDLLSSNNETLNNSTSSLLIPQPIQPLPPLPSLFYGPSDPPFSPPSIISQTTRGKKRLHQEVIVIDSEDSEIKHLQEENNRLQARINELEKNLMLSELMRKKFEFATYSFRQMYPNRKKCSTYGCESPGCFMEQNNSSADPSLIKSFCINCVPKFKTITD